MDYLKWFVKCMLLQVPFICIFGFEYLKFQVVFSIVLTLIINKK